MNLNFLFKFFLIRQWLYTRIDGNITGEDRQQSKKKNKNKHKQT